MNRHIVLTRRPDGVPDLSDFALEERPAPALSPGQFRVVNRIFSMDPAIRGFLDDRPSYLPPVALGEPVNGMTLGEVVESDNPDYPVGTYVRALATWSETSILDRDALGLEIVTPKEGVALEHYMGALGPVGLTAWVGLFAVGEAKAGETVLVSAAAGATGSTVGQLAKAHGCTVIGMAGSAEKVATLRELGFDAAIDYRATDDLSGAIAAAAPAGIDVYFDNVGGETLETVLPLMAERGRVAVCGMIGQYNDADNPHGVKTLWQLVVKRLTMKGFLTYDHAGRLAEAQADLDRLAASGELKPLANVTEGFEHIPDAFIRLMSGETIGKTLVRA
jgi:NADPH-dependent curcumin reductase CurA